YFLSPLQIVYQIWQSDPKQTPAFWGITGLFIFLIVLYKIIVQKKHVDLATKFLMFTTLFSLFMTTHFSAIIWENVPLLAFFQLPWRFLSLSVWATALLIPFALAGTSKNKKHI